MVIIVMGVSGSGKTTVGKRLAKALGWQFVDADDFHSEANKEKLVQGIPLSDEDRAPWLAQIHKNIQIWLAEGNSTILACSALKENYRQKLGEPPEVQYVYLHGSFGLLQKRVEERAKQHPDHPFNPTLLQSQFDTLEAPENALNIESGWTMRQKIDCIVHDLKLTLAAPDVNVPH